MPKQTERDVSELPQCPPRVSRRAMIGGLAAVAATPWLAGQGQAQTKLSPIGNPTTLPISSLPAQPDASAPVSLTSAAVTGLPSLPLARQGHTATAISGTFILIAGGLSETGLPLTDAVVYGTDGSVTAVASMNTARSGHAAVLMPYGMVLILGGSGSAGPLADAEIYDPSSNTWTPTMPLALPRTGHSAIRVAGGRILVFGGYSQGTLADVETYLTS